MRRKNKKFYIVLILIVLFGVSVGYAAISRVLTINGNSEIKQNTWDIHFENIQIKNGSVTATKEPTLENSNTSVNFSFMLNLPGDYYEFTVDAVNKGTIDAMIDSITKTPELTTEQAKYLNYIIEYQNGEQISSKQLVSKNSFVRIKVRVEYRTDINENDLPTTTETLNLGFTVNYVQSDGTDNSVKDNGKSVIFANGSLDDIGTVVTIGTEQFYTIGTEGDNVKLLSMYNLYVGGKFDTCYDNLIIPYGIEATGMQNLTMLGSYTDGTLGCRPGVYYEGITVFSSDSQKGINYSDYNGSIVEGYVNNYKNKLEENFGIEIEEARLITKDELMNTETFACVENHYCSNKYPWIYLTSYWTGSASTYDDVWTVSSVGYFSGYYDYNNFSDYGVRPVIIISKSLF